MTKKALVFNKTLCVWRKNYFDSFLLLMDSYFIPWQPRNEIVIFLMNYDSNEIK